MLYGILASNLFLLILILFSMTNMITELSKKGFFSKQLQKLNLMIFQTYNWFFTVPLLNFLGFCFINTKDYQDLTIAIINIIIIILLANALEFIEISVSFKIKDHLAQDRDLSSKLLFNYKLFLCVVIGMEFLIDPLLIFFYIWTILQYSKSPKFHSHSTSNLYYSGLIFSLLISVFYYMAYLEILDARKLDFAYIFFFSGTITVKFSIRLLDSLITEKIEMIISSKGEIDPRDFQLYNRELYRHFKKTCEGNLDSRILFLTFFSNHVNRCKRETGCNCKSIKLRHKKDFLLEKKTFLKLLAFRFEDYLKDINEKYFSMIFLNYCSFLLTVLKAPGKVLNLLFKYKHKLTGVDDLIQVEILIKGSKKLLEKKLLNNDLYAQTLASVIIFDREVKHTELRLKRILEDNIKLHEILTQDADSNNNTRFLEIGENILENLEKFKAKIQLLLDKNGKNARLLQLTALTIKYLTEDLTFRNFYKQLNIKRINQALQRKRADALDIFGHDSGVVFISLGESPGSIDKISKNFLRIFNYENSNELYLSNINILMPEVFSVSHDGFLKEFIESGNGVFLTSGMQSLYAVSRLGFLLNIRLLLRLDTIFHKDFVIAGYLQVQKNVNNRIFITDINGNLMNYTKECENLLNFQNKPIELQINMTILMPELRDKIFYLEEGNNDKDFSDFRQKGFLLLPKEASHFEKLHFNGEIQFKIKPTIANLDKEGKIQNIKENLMILYRMSKSLNVQDYSFYRCHYHMKTLSYANNKTQLRLFEILDMFEVTDLTLFSRYLARTMEKLKFSLQKANLPSSNEIFEEKTNKILQNPNNSLMESIIINLTEKNKDNNNTNNTNINNNNKTINNYLKNNSNPNLTKNLTIPTDNTRKPQPPSIENSIKDLESEEPSSNKNLDNPLNPDLSKKSPSFEVEESEFSMALALDNNDIDFEQRISEISNNQANRLSSGDSLTQQDERTQTYEASQISRVSSQASGDAKKNTISALMKGMGGKLAYFEIFGYGIVMAIIGVSLMIFLMSRNESFNLQKSIDNSGLFHDQLAPVCVLVRDVQVYEWNYKGIIENPLYLSEISKSLNFSYSLFEKAYKKAIDQTDSSMEFLYTTFLTVSVVNLTIYSYIDPNNGSILSISFVEARNQIKEMRLDITQAIMFFLAASKHVYEGFLLNNSNKVSDLENYHWLLKENILEFIFKMLEVFKLNKAKISDSVGYLTKLNWILLVVIITFIITFMIGAGFIAIKNKIKCQKFCSLFWFFPENELQERILKLTSLLARYFDGKAGITLNSEKYNLSTDLSLSQTASTSKFKALSRSFQFGDLKTDIFSNKKLKYHRSRLRRTNSLNLMKNSNFQYFLWSFFIILIGIFGVVLGVYVYNYNNTSVFIENVLDIMNDVDSLETYSITISIRYALNSILLGLFDQPADIIQEKVINLAILLQDIDLLQISITDLSKMFKRTGSSNILTDLKYEFFTNDLCKVGESLKSIDSFREASVLLGSEVFCDNLLKNVLTKGSTSLVFSINELFEGWGLLMQSSNYSKIALLEIVNSQEYIDANLALAYVYAIGKYYSSEMLKKSVEYFDGVRNGNILWGVFTLAMILVLFWVGFRKWMKQMRESMRRNFSMIVIFPFEMINSNKVLENKISKMFRMQRL